MPRPKRVPLHHIIHSENRFFCKTTADLNETSLVSRAYQCWRFMTWPSSSDLIRHGRVEYSQLGTLDLGNFTTETTKAKRKKSCSLWLARRASQKQSARGIGASTSNVNDLPISWRGVVAFPREERRTSPSGRDKRLLDFQDTRRLWSTKRWKGCNSHYYFDVI